MTNRSRRDPTADRAPHHHPARSHVADYDAAVFERAAALFRAAGDLSRLRLLHQLDNGEWCVTELAAANETKLSTLSQQLRILHTQRIVKRRRDGKHIYYSLADEHVRELVRTALDHASELTPSPSSRSDTPSPAKGKKRKP